MSSAVFSTTSAQRRFFILDAENALAVCPEEAFPAVAFRPVSAQHPAVRIQPELDRASLIQAAIKNQKSKILPSVKPASRFEVRPAPEMVTSGIVEVDALTGGLSRGCLTEICGLTSSGRTTLLLSALAAATRRGEFCAVVDAGDALDPQSAMDAGVDLEQMLWVRCGIPPQKNNSPQRHRVTKKRNSGRDAELVGAPLPRSLRQGWEVPTEKINSEQRLEQLLRAADLLLESGGFGLIALDLADLPPQTARRIPMTTWFRFRRAVEHTSTVLLVIERQSIAGSCSSLLMKLRADEKPDFGWRSASSAAMKPQVLTEIAITAEVARSRMERKPARSAEVTFVSKTAWAR
jgi:recombination protein RecA